MCVHRHSNTQHIQAQASEHARQTYTNTHLGSSRHEGGSLDGDLINSRVNVRRELVAHSLMVGLVVYKLSADLDAGNVLIVLPKVEEKTVRVRTSNVRKTCLNLELL
jgi:hypothetical protein